MITIIYTILQIYNIKNWRKVYQQSWATIKH